METKFLELEVYIEIGSTLKAEGLTIMKTLTDLSNSIILLIEYF